VRNISTQGALDSAGVDFFFNFFFVDVIMVGGMRRRPAPRVAQEGGLVRPGVKGKVYLHEEEEQLCCSVLHVSQDRIVETNKELESFGSES